jgi:hypothetical protein
VSHTMEGFRYLEEDLREITTTMVGSERQLMRSMLKSILKDQDSSTFIQNTLQEVVAEKASPEILRKLIALLIVTVISDRRQAENNLFQDRNNPDRLSTNEAIASLHRDRSRAYPGRRWALLCP